MAKELQEVGIKCLYLTNNTNQQYFFGRWTLTRLPIRAQPDSLIGIAIQTVGL